MQTSIARIIAETEAEGPGKRFAIWFQGCPLRCVGCCNPEFLPFKGGELVQVVEVMQQISVVQRENGIEGISLLGGEPFAHAEAAAEIAANAQSLGLTVMIYSGYTLQQLQAQKDAQYDRLLSHCDLLVDGPYDQTQPEPVRRWIGSKNQVVHFLTSRYSPADPCWTKSNTLEIRVRDNEISINGFPASHAKPIWKGLKRQKT
jgi:anaerobic ribonucleoside-triphosphate reductase activating protein